MMKLRILAAGLMLAVASPNLALAHEFKVGSLEIAHPYARAMLPGAKVGGGYLAITNEGKEPDRLIAIASPAAAMVQVHAMTMEGQVMKMRELKAGLEIKPGETVVLKPGGYHVMFMNVEKPFAEGQMIKATLTFEKAGKVDVAFKVEGPTADHSGEAADHDHSMEGMKPGEPMKMDN